MHIENAAFCDRIRENDEEMKACDAWCKQVRFGLLDLDHLNAGYYMGDVVKLVKVIQKMDPIGLKGQRSFVSSKYKSLLTDLNFNAVHPFKKTLMHSPEVISDDEMQTEIDISLTASFNDDEIPATDTMVLVAFGIEFASILSN